MQFSQARRIATHRTLNDEEATLRRGKLVNHEFGGHLATLLTLELL